MSFKALKRSVSPSSKVMATSIAQSEGKVETPVRSMDSIKNFVGKVLQLPNDVYTAWDIIDTYPRDNPQLALAHYNDNYEPYIRMYEPLRRIRGTIVDLNTGAVVADSYGYTQTLPCYEPLSLETSADNPEGSILVATEIATYINTVDAAPIEVPKVNIDIRRFDRKNTRIFLGYEGALVRVFKWQGQLMFSTHRRIDATRSHWGGRTGFLDLYKQLGGPEFDTLFGQESTSPYCHLFLIVHNDLRLATSTQDNRILYLGVKKVWDEEVFAKEGAPYFWQLNEEFVLKLPDFNQVEPNAFSPELNRAMFQQPEIDIETANKFLFPKDHAPQAPSHNEYPIKYDELVIDYTNDGKNVNEIYFNGSGHSTLDDRLNGGDFVILYTQTAEGTTIIYRLESSAFEYRVMVTANDPNMYHRFVVEMVKFTKGKPEDLMEKFPRYIGTDGRPLDLRYPQGRQVYWWSIFYDAVPPAYKGEVDKFYARYNRDINVVSEFIMKEYQKVTDEEELKRIGTNTHNRFVNLREIALSTARYTGKSPYTVVKSLLYKETGPSLYKMISTVRNIKRYRARQESVTEKE